MNKLEQMRIERTKKITRMQAIIDAAEGEGRELTAAEQTEWDTLNSAVRDLGTKIKRAERMAYLNRGKSKRENDDDDDDDDDSREDDENDDDDDSRNDDDPDERSGRRGSFQHMRKAKPYSVSKAISEYVTSGGVAGLTGVEAEQHRELSKGVSSNGLLIPYRRDVNTTTHGIVSDKFIDPDLSIIGKVPLYQSMGVRILPGLHGVITLSAKTPEIAEKVNEKVKITKTTEVPTIVTLSPKRYGITDLFSKELLAQINPAVHAAILGDMIVGCDRKITADVYSAAVTAATEKAGGDLTPEGLDVLMEAVDTDGAFAMARSSFFQGKSVKIDEGSGRFLFAMTGTNGIGNTYDGVSSYYSTLFNDGDGEQRIIYGAWEEMYLGFWEALEILLNPYTFQKEGQIEVTVNRLADVVCRNNSAFVKSPNLI